MHDIKIYSIDKTVKYFYFIIFVWFNWSILGDDIYFDNRPVSAAIILIILWLTAIFSVYKIALINDEKLIIYRIAYKTYVNMEDILSIDESGLGFRIVCKTKRIYIQDILSKKSQLIKTLTSINNNIKYHKNS